MGPFRVDADGKSGSELGLLGTVHGNNAAIAPEAEGIEFLLLLNLKIDEAAFFGLSERCGTKLGVGLGGGCGTGRLGGGGFFFVDQGHESNLSCPVRFTGETICWSSWVTVILVEDGLLIPSSSSSSR